MGSVNKDFKVKHGLVVTDGGTFGGTVTVATPTDLMHAATKAYVDANSGGGSGSGIITSSTEPQTPTDGLGWLDTTTNNFYIYSNLQWVEISGGTATINVAAPITYNTQTQTIGINQSQIEISTSQISDYVSPDSYLSEAVSSDITLVKNTKYFIDSSSARTLTLPANPVLGDELIIFDSGSQSATNNITILRNGKLINGIADDAIIDVNQCTSIFTYSGTALGWKFE